MKTQKKKLKSFVAGKFSFNEYRTVQSYFENEKFDNSLKEQLHEDWNETNSTSDKGEVLKRILDELHIKIASNNSKKKYRLINVFSRIAAILIIPAFISIAVLSYLSFVDNNSNSWVEVHAPMGARTKFHLPDGSEGWLNSGSIIKYSAKFNKTREVEVTGEAWFDVVHQDGEKFKVSTPYFDVTVLGTQFNVLAYYDEEIAEVILEKGKVLVEGKYDKFKTELIPDQGIKYFKKSHKVIKNERDASSYNSWRNGQLIFKNVDMGEIALRLERKYNVDIELHGDQLKKSVFRATFQDESIEEIMNMMATVAPIAYKIHPKIQNEEKEISKRKIEIWFRK